MVHNLACRVQQGDNNAPVALGFAAAAFGAAAVAAGASPTGVRLSVGEAGD